MNTHESSEQRDSLTPTAWIFLGLWAAIYMALAIGRGIPYPMYEVLSFIAFMTGATLVTRLGARRHGIRRISTRRESESNE